MGWSAALVADLLFGSRLQGALGAAGVELVLCADAERLRRAIAERGGPPDELIVDLGDSGIDVAAALASLGGDGGAGPGATRTLGFYSHVHPAQRAQGERAGLDVIVPRSRLAREAPELLAALRAP